MSEVFENYCSFCMSLGMSYQEYWYGSSDLIKYYKESYDLRKKMLNELMWLNGIYISKAVACTVNEKNKYPEKPLDIFPKTEAEKEREAELERKKIIEYLNSFKTRWENGNNR